MTNRLTKLFAHKKRGILNVYFTAGHPTIDSISTIINSLSDHGADIIEIGMPYSDPMADGPTIQDSSMIALKNGMNLSHLFEQIAIARKTTQLPLILMGYYNQLIQYGIESFVQKSAEVGVDGFIIPDLPMAIFERDHQQLFEDHNISLSFLITPQTSEERIRKADELSSGFIYMVSQSSITGSTRDINQDQIVYFDRVNAMHLKNPRLIGFGIHDKETKDMAFRNSNGAIIGSAFIRAIGSENGTLEERIENFFQGIN